MRKGLFITFEGADGCGKTTQQGLCAKYLEEKGVEVLLSREPGATALGVKLREILLHYPDPVASECETFLYLADRAQHIQEKIIPALEEGKIRGDGRICKLCVKGGFLFFQTGNFFLYFLYALAFARKLL